MHEVIPSLSPFWWNDRFYNELQCGNLNGRPAVMAEPPRTELEKVMKRRLFPRPSSSTIYLTFGYKCFTEDYPQSQSSLPRIPFLVAEP